MVATLTRYAAKTIDSHILAYDVAVKRGKYLMALQALIRGKALNPVDPDIFFRVVQFLHKVQAEAKANHPLVGEVITLEQEGLQEGSSLSGYLEAFKDKAKKLSLKHRVAAVKATLLLKPEAGQEIMTYLADGLKDGRGINIKNAKEALEVSSFETWE